MMFLIGQKTNNTEGATMTIKELVSKLQELDQDDLVVLVVTNDNEVRAFEPDVVGRDGWHQVSEIHLGEMITG